MKNISFNGEAIELAVGIKYIVIDALYANEIRLELPKLTTDDIFNEIRGTVFPYTDTPFAEYVAMETVFTLDKIKKIDYDEANSQGNSVFSTDSGVIIFISEKKIMDFVSKFDYDELTDSSTELLNIAYWSSVVKDFNFSDVAVIVSPGIDSDVDFDGSGTYKLE